MALTQEDLQAIGALMDAKLAPVLEQQQVHTRSITKLENSVMHELKLLNENLPDAIARHEDLKRLENTVEAHDARIYALEQQAANS